MEVIIVKVERTFLTIIGITNLAVSLYAIQTLKRIGEELNQIESWKSIPKKHYF